MTTPARRLWWVAAGTAWAVLLIGLGGYATGDDPPTIRDQRTVAEALPVVDRVAGQVLAATGAAAVAELRPLRADGCRITPARDGRELTRDVLVYTDPAAAPGLLDAVAAALPPAWDASVWHRPDGTEHRFSADAGEFVGVDGTTEQDGALVRFEITTGCRPLDGADLPAPVPAPAGPELDRVVRALGAAARAATADTVPCPSGPSARAVTVDAGPAPADLGTGLRALVPPAVVRAEPTAYAWRAGGLSIVVTAVDGRVRATATTGCIR